MGKWGWTVWRQHSQELVPAMHQKIKVEKNAVVFTVIDVEFSETSL
jgi:hypothetical protein